jgi:hypothetical protein
MVLGNSAEARPLELYIEANLASDGGAVKQHRQFPPQPTPLPLTAEEHSVRCADFLTGKGQRQSEILKGMAFEANYCCSGHMAALDCRRGGRRSADRGTG